MPIASNDKSLNNNIASVEPYCRDNETICFWKAYPNDPAIKEFSENIVRITGYSNEEINNIPGGFYSLIHSEDLSHVKKHHNDFFNNLVPHRSISSFFNISKQYKGFELFILSLPSLLFGC